MNQKSRKRLDELIFLLRHSLNEREREYVLRSARQKEGIPISAFKAPLSSFEIIVRYLRDAEKQKFAEIAVVLNRKRSTIYGTYSNSRKKFKGPLNCSDRTVIVPLTIFKKRKYSVLESVVSYLKEKEKLSFSAIAKLLHKSYSTVTSTYWNYKKKRGGS